MDDPLIVELTISLISDLVYCLVIVSIVAVNFSLGAVGHRNCECIGLSMKPSGNSDKFIPNFVEM